MGVVLHPPLPALVVTSVHQAITVLLVVLQRLNAHQETSVLEITLIVPVALVIKVITVL